jgi:hypothetical protein
VISQDSSLAWFHWHCESPVASEPEPRLVAPLNARPLTAADAGGKSLPVDAYDSTAIVTSHASFTDPALIEKLRAKASRNSSPEVPLAMAQERYGGHFQVAMQDLHESDDLRVLDFNGEPPG